MYFKYDVSQSLQFLTNFVANVKFYQLFRERNWKIMPVKYVFVTGGVVSGLGKGITAASLGRLLKSRGYKVTMQKFDPYINIDPEIGRAHV